MPHGLKLGLKWIRNYRYLHVVKRTFLKATRLRGGLSLHRLMSEIDQKAKYRTQTTVSVPTRLRTSAQCHRQMCLSDPS